MANYLFNYWRLDLKDMFLRLVKDYAKLYHTTEELADAYEFKKEWEMLLEDTMKNAANLKEKEEGLIKKHWTLLSKTLTYFRSFIK